MLDLELDLPSEEIRKWAMLCHLAGGVGAVLFPMFGGVIASVGVWLVKRDVGAYVDDQGREAVNFQITMLLYCAVASIAVFILKVVLIGHLLVWIPGLVVIAQIGGSIVGAIRAHDGESFRYPCILRFI